VEQARLAVKHAELNGGDREYVISRTLLADALHQAGSRPEAERRFSEAEARQNERNLDFPPLYTLWRYQYYDFLLTASERAAWQCILQSPLNLNLPTSLESCRTVAMRATQELKRLIEQVPAVWPLTSVSNTSPWETLHYMEAILGGGTLDPCRLPLENAVKVLRLARDLAHLPRGLLARAWLRALEGARTGLDRARSDLNEAWEIAERGPMPLFLADIHLHRARLFFREKEYPKEWGSPQTDLAAAEKLIKECGYLRRMEELKDAKAAVANSPQTSGPPAERA